MAKRLRGQPASGSSFVPLNGTGKKPPLFAVGWCHEYRDLSRALGKDQPFYQMDVYALQEERLIVEAPLFTTVQAIANCFVREILSLQSFGPYFLAGRCEGSIVALEIARQLQGQGHQIGELMQFDTPATGYFTVNLPWYRKVSWALARVGRGEQQYVLTLARNKIRRSLAPTTEDYIWKIIWDAVRAYETDKRFKGEIVLFRAEQQPPMPIDNVAVGWDRLGAVRIYDVPGDHVRLFINPTAQSIIQEVLEDAQRRVAAAPSSKFQEIARGDVDPR